MTSEIDPSWWLALGLTFLAAACGKPTDSGAGADDTGGEDTGGGVLTVNPCDTDVQEQLSHLSTSAGGAAQDPSCVDGEGNFLIAPDVGGHAGLDACRPWVPPGQLMSDCPIGEKCMPLDGDLDRVWDSTACVTISTSPLPLGAVCTPPDPADPEGDPCDAGLLCWADSTSTGTCVQACQLATLPADDTTGVANKLEAANPDEVCVFTDFDAVAVALPLCNPVDPAAFCDPTLGCYPVHNSFVCLAASGAPDPGDLGEACSFVNDCSPGLLCKDASALPPGCASAACCTEFCDLQDPSCSAAGSTCQPWFQPTQAPFHPTTDFRDVGFCGVDPNVSMFVETFDPFEVDNGTSYVGGLLATCKAVTGGNRYDLAAFDRDLEELCDALPLCAAQTDLYVELAGTLVTEAGVTPPPGGPRALGTAEIDVVDGIATYTDGIEMTVGHGQHTVEFCAFDDLSVEIGCMQQDVKVDPPMAAGTQTGGAPTGEIAGQIAPGFVALSGKTGATQLTGLTNDGQATITLPTGFTFPFHGTSYGALRVQANGGVFFGTSGTALGPTNVALPASTAPDLAVLWDDHNPAAGGGVWTYYDATRFIVSWENVPHTAGPAGTSTSFQVHLLPSGVFEFHYRDTHYTTTSSLNGAKSATIGSQRPNDTAWLQVSHNNALWGDGKSRRALRVSSDDCIISSLQYDDWVECNDPELEVAPESMIDACERTDGKVWVPAPELPSLCGWPTRYEVVGQLVDGGTSASTMVPLTPPRDIVGAAVTAAPGVYRAQWRIMNGPLLVSGPYEQILTVAPNFAVKYGAATSTTYGFVAIATTGTPLNLGADAEATVTAPFQFPFYGGRYTSITIGANGAIRFNAGDVHYNNVTLPSSVSTSPDIALFWDDLNPASSGDVYTEYDATNDRFIISWEAVPHHVNVGAGSFQMHLYVTGRIEFHYADGNFGTSSYNNGRSATIGIQDHVAGLTSIHNVLVSHNTAWAVMDGQARAFQPVCDN